jgi:cyclophilin family peptidyl-prolyl cis-trans isomerase
MNFYEKHNAAILVIIGLILLSAVITYLGTKSVQYREVLTSSVVKRSTESFSGAVITTNYGAIEIVFLPKKAPNTVNNFVKLAQKNFYDGTKFHRVIKDFMIQGGDPNSKGDDRTLYGRGGPGYVFKDEINDEPLVSGVVAMANSGPDTNGSQFFIITAPATPWLQGKHTAFAKVVDGMDVVNEISAVATDKNDAPIEPVAVEKVTLQ